MTQLHYSPLESVRFGLRIFRASNDTLDTEALLAAVDRERVDVVILRLPARELGKLDALRRRGLIPIVADTLVQYDIDLTAGHVGNWASAAVTLRAATPADADLLESLSREIFHGYVTHYHANQLFAASRILDGYAQWASDHVRVGADGAAWIVEFCGEIAGFSCYRMDALTGVATGVLNGVVPALRSRGIYRAMMQQMLRRFREDGMRRFAISTQVQNIAVQRTWTAHGLRLRGADNTVHLNTLRAHATEKAECSGADAADHPRDVRAASAGSQ